MKLPEIKLQLVMWCQDIYDNEASPYVYDMMLDFCFYLTTAIITTLES